MPTIGLGASIDCRLCGSGSLVPVSAHSYGGFVYHIAHCPKCDLYQATEQRDAVSPTYVDLNTDSIDADRLWCQDTHKHPAFRQWLRLMRSYGTFGSSHGTLSAAMEADIRNPSRMSVLDVGCGTGGFLRFARDAGFIPFGFDASPVQADYARREFHAVRRAVAPGEYLRAIDHDDLKFRVITLWDVFEHIRDPHSYLAGLHSVLAPDGVLFLSVPSGGAIPWKLKLGALRRKLPELIPWEHVFYYTPRSIRLALESNGFEVLRVGTVVCYPRPFSPFEVLRRAGFLLLRALPSLAPQIYALARPH